MTVLSRSCQVCMVRVYRYRNWIDLERKDANGFAYYSCVLSRDSLYCIISQRMG